MTPDHIKVRLPSHYGTVWLPDEAGEPVVPAKGGDTVTVPRRWAEAYGLADEGSGAPVLHQETPEKPTEPGPEEDGKPEEPVEDAEVARLRAIAEAHEVSLGRARTAAGIGAKLREAGISPGEE